LKVPLDVAEHELVLMGPGTYMGINVIAFDIDPQLADRELLASLVTSAGYAHNYAEAFNPDASITEPALHGKYWRSSITAQSFKPCDVASAEAVLNDWANNQDWTDPSFRQPQDARARLRRVFELFANGAVYRLSNPGKEDEHDWGWVVGVKGFHEFVVIDRNRGRLSLLVASDD